MSLLFSRKKTKTMHPKLLLVFAVIFIVSMLYLLLRQEQMEDVLIGVGEDEFRVLVAETPMERYTGLGGRATIAPYDGMLFLYTQARPYGIVMRDMQFALDIVWIREGLIVDIEERVPLESDVNEEELTVYRPDEAADLILEFPAGWAEDFDIEVGDRVEFRGE